MALPRGFQILLETDDDRLAWQARRLTGHNAYRVEPQPGAIGDEGAAQEHRLCLALADGRVWPAPARRGHALDAGLPWVFEERPGGPPRWVREGGGSVTTATALIAVPSGYRVVADAGGSVDLGRLAVLDRRAYRVCAGATVLSPEGQRWRIRTGQADAREPDFHWVGKPVWAGLVDPPLAFEGRTRLYDGLTSIAPHLLSWHPNNPGYFGPAVAALDQGGERLHRARLVVLPAGAAIKVIPSGECGGEMRFDGWGAASASVTQPDVTSLSRRDAGVLILALTWHAAADERRVPPEWVEVTLTWPHNPTPARVRLPFPARGVHAFDGAGRTLPCNAWVPAHRLIGLRLVAVGGSANMVLRLSLRHTMGGGKQVDARIPIHRPANTSRVELRLQDHADHIDRLLAADELLDAWVEATLCDGPQDLFQLRLSRYLCPLERTDLDVRLTQEGLRRIDATVLADLPVHALRLESPGDEPCRLEPNYSEGVPTGAWAFDAQNREPGSWFIYPGTDSQGRFRPTLWVIEGETPAASPLTRALAVLDQVERAEALDEVIAAMAADYCESCWPDLERLAGHLGHLPLSSLDLWRRLAHSPAGMVALALRLHADLADGFVRRFALELPFAWEAVPVRAWQFGAECLRRQCQAWFGETQCNKEFATRLTQALSAVAAACPALDILLGLVRCEALGAQCPEITMLRHPASDGMLRSQLFDGDDCAVQRLLRAHTEEQWPPAGTLTKWLSRERQGDGLIAAIFTSGHPDWRDTVIHLPILLAFQTATSATDGWFKHPGRIHSLRCHRAFDPDWFDEAFARTIARCIARGLLIS
jgi:hypothetical protein